MSRIQPGLSVNSAILQRVQFPAAVLWISEHLQGRGQRSSLFSKYQWALMVFMVAYVFLSVYVLKLLSIIFTAQCGV